MINIYEQIIVELKPTQYFHQLLKWTETIVNDEYDDLDIRIYLTISNGGYKNFRRRSSTIRRTYYSKEKIHLLLLVKIKELITIVQVYFLLFIEFSSQDCQY